MYLPLYTSFSPVVDQLAELNEHSKASSTSLCHVHFNLTSRYSDPVISLFDTHKLDNTRLQNIPTPVSKPVSSCWLRFVSWIWAKYSGVPRRTRTKPQTWLKPRLALRMYYIGPHFWDSRRGSVSTASSQNIGSSSRYSTWTVPFHCYLVRISYTSRNNGSVPLHVIYQCLTALCPSLYQRW